MGWEQRKMKVLISSTAGKMTTSRNKILKTLLIFKRLCGWKKKKANFCLFVTVRNLQLLEHQVSIQTYLLFNATKSLKNQLLRYLTFIDSYSQET